ncbi:MAG: ATP synthase F1 subunit delta [Chloroflexi bacterium]|nr:ATP synthase F1 subunit delta [Chloroflexota bacterium]MBM3173748.1 ATP synthase F1 subunit delta [Chloroflexota bacterium]MBM3174171.1 ATP synthase F1 subunit delta [Chloroflexota bacterium]MBM4449239.1 ATP synthase F1 subunit delta [Chloroflexota bacterium]
MPATVSSKRYAQAVFEIARENGELEKWRPDLKKITELAQDSETVSLLENPKVPFDLKAKLAQEKLGKVSPLALNLAYILILKGRLRSIPQIADEYQRLLDEHRGIRHTEVTTAIPLDDTSKRKIARSLETMTGKKLSLSLKVDADIIGGFVARIDDSLIDCSIRSELEQMKKGLAETAS